MNAIQEIICALDMREKLLEIEDDTGIFEKKDIFIYRSDKEKIRKLLQDALDQLNNEEIWIREEE
jgi:hypothetical protein